MRPRVHPGWRPFLLPVVATSVAVLLLALVGTVAFRQNRTTVQEGGLVRVRSNADAAIRAVSRQSQDYLRTARAGARDPSVVAALKNPGPATRSAAAAPLATVAIGKSAPAAFLCDNRGRYVTGHPFQRSLVGVGFGYRDWFRGVSSSGRAYVSSAYRSMVTGRPLVVGVAAPVSAHGRRVGYLTVLWQLASIRSVAEGSRRDDGISITVTDQRGQVLAPPVLAVDNRRQPRAVDVPSLTRRALAGERVKTVTGDAVVAAGPVPGLGWTVTARLPLSTAMAPAREFRGSLLVSLGIALLTLLGALAYAVVLTGRGAKEREVVVAQAKHLTTLFAAAPVGIIEGLPDGTILDVNDALGQLLGYSRDELLDMRASELADPSSESAVADALGSVLDGSVTSYTGERVYRARSGGQVPVLVSVVVLRDALRKFERMVAFVVDLTSLRATEAALLVSENRFRKVFDEGLIGKALTSESGVILRANRALATCLGVQVDDLLGRPLSSCFESPEDQVRVEDVVASKSRHLDAEAPLHGSRGAEVWGRVSVRWVPEQTSEWVLLAQFEDITAQRVAERRLLNLALHDDLTGLPNRRLLMERCAQAFAVARSGRSGTCVTALFLDLDGFKAVNDRAGHQAGDDLLRSIAADLVHTLRPADTVARVGGDEFVVLLDSDDGIDAGRLVADKLADRIRRQVPCGEQAFLTISASIGIARADLSVEPDLLPEELLGRADATMYRAKQRGRGRHKVFDSEPGAGTRAGVERGAGPPVQSRP